MGLDSSAKMLAVARNKAPEASFVQADMADFSLLEGADVMSAMYGVMSHTVHLEQLYAVVRNLALSLAPGALMMLDTWFTPDEFPDGQTGMQAVRDGQLKVSVAHIWRRDGLVASGDFHFTVATPTGVESFFQHHEYGLFEISDYLGAMQEAGLEAWHHPSSHFVHGLVLGRKSW